MVILRPISQFGCFSASSGRTVRICSLFQVRNGPPEAVRRIFSTRLLDSPFKDWNTALCSLSTGSMETPHFSARSIIICPAVTNVSLLARAICLPDWIAAMVGRMPIIPTTAVTTVFASSSVAASINPSIPETIRTFISRTFVLNSCAFFSSQTAARRGLNSRICCSSSLILLWAARAVISRSPCSLATSSVWVPIDPVEPNIAIFLISVSISITAYLTDTRKNISARK